MILEKRFKIEFTVDPEFMEKPDRARSLLSNKYPRGLELERLFGILLDDYPGRNSLEGMVKRRAKREAKKAEKRVKYLEDKQNKLMENNNSRLVPQAVRDEVFARDKGRCTYIGKDGLRCEKTWNLQIDHIITYARGGDNTSCNLRLLCARHNFLEAEWVCGKEFMKRFHRRE